MVFLVTDLRYGSGEVHDIFHGVENYDGSPS